MPHCYGNMVDFRYEPLAYMLKTGLPELAMECWEKTDDGFHISDRFSPDWNAYQAHEDNKDLGFISMRDNGELVGYAVVKVNSDIHHKGKRIGVLHDIYIKDGKRGNATAFFHYIEKLVMKMGAERLDVAQRMSIEAHRGGISKLYSFLGYFPMETIWSKKLEFMGEA